VADRLARGGVVDFIAVARWPAFNLADAAMTCGTLAVAWSVL
jgi:lipoprotein signal peptidase